MQSGWEHLRSCSPVYVVSLIQINSYKNLKINLVTSFLVVDLSC